MRVTFLTLFFLLVVCAGIANAQRPFLTTTDTVTISSSPVTRNEQTSQGVLLSGLITGTGTPYDVSLQSATTGSVFSAVALNQTASGNYKYEMLVPADSYYVYVSFTNGSFPGPEVYFFNYLEAAIALTIDGKLNLALPAVLLSPVSGSVSGVNVLSSAQTVIAYSQSISGFGLVEAIVQVSGGTYSVSLPAGLYNNMSNNPPDGWYLDQTFVSATGATTDVTEYLGGFSVTSGPNSINLPAFAFGTATLSGNISFSGSGSVPANTLLNLSSPSTGGIVGSQIPVQPSGAYSFIVPTGFAYDLAPAVDVSILGAAMPVTATSTYEPAAFQTAVISSNTAVSPAFPAIPAAEAPATLQGTITGPGGTPLHYCEIEVDSPSLTLAASTSYSLLMMTDAFGHYSGQFPLGTYNLFAFCSLVTTGDMDGDGKADMTVFRPSNGTFYELDSDPTVVAQQWGTNGDVPVRGDFDGDGITDIGVWRPSTGQWFIIPSSNPGSPIQQQWGTAGDIPVPGDYDGDGLTDFAVFRPSTGQWFVVPSSNPGAPFGRQWGTNGDIPVPADYDGDGQTDFAVFRPSVGQWFIIPSGNPGTPIGSQWGTIGDMPVPGDYDGDGKADVGVFRPSNGQWYIIPSSNPGVPLVKQWGTSGDIPVPEDYDGDQKTDIAVWRGSTGSWYVLPSGSPGTFTATSWGTTGDVTFLKPAGQ